MRTFLRRGKPKAGVTKYSRCAEWHRPGRCPLDPGVAAERAARFADVKASGNAFADVRREG